MLGLVFIGCTSTPTIPVDPGPTPAFELDDDLPYTSPWPSDRDRDADGSVSYTRFHRPSAPALPETYVRNAEERMGWGANSPIHIRLDGDPDLDRMPTPAESVSTDSPLQLIDVDPESPDRGTRIPLVWHLTDAATRYVPEHLLSVAPLPGFPLGPNRTYAVVLTTDAFSVAPAFRAAAETDDYEALRETLSTDTLSLDQIAVASQWTIGDPLRELTIVADFIQNELNPGAISADPMEVVLDFASHTVYQAQLTLPVFTHGERPYSFVGGGFRFAEDGAPEIHSFDPSRISVCMPNRPPPADGWPVVLYQHGTGGDFLTPCRSDAALSPSEVVTSIDAVLIGLEQPLHGERGGPAGDFDHFNLINIESGVTNFRQGAADAIYAANALASSAQSVTLPDGTAVPLSNQVAFVGHSQGGITGALAAPYFDGDVQSVVLSGAGGYLASTVAHREIPLDIASLVAGLAEFRDDEEVHELHPLLGLVQHVADRTDPVNYAPYWYAEALEGSSTQVPVSVLVTSGETDTATPFMTGIAMAAAGRTPSIGPRATEMVAVDLRGDVSTPNVRMDNARAFDGQMMSSGFLQWANEGHFVIFQQPRAMRTYRDYIQSSFEGRPTLTLPSP